MRAVCLNVTEIRRIEINIPYLITVKFLEFVNEGDFEHHRNQKKILQICGRINEINATKIMQLKNMGLKRNVRC